MGVFRRWLPATLALAAVVGAIAWAMAGLPGAPAACPAAGCDCEAPRSAPSPAPREAASPASVPRQPANAWSALALAAAGILLLGASPTAARDAVAAGALVFAGTAAFLFHAGLTAWAARLDGIAVAVLVAALGAHLWWPCRRPGAPAGTRAAAARLLPWLLLALGGLCWALGRSSGPWCRPTSLLQAHAAWHLLAAAAIFLWLRRQRRAGPGASPISPVPLASRPEEGSVHEPAP